MTDESASATPRVIDGNERILMELARDKLHHQIAFADALDQKLAMLLAAGSTLLGLLAAVLALGPNGNAGVRAGLLVSALVCYAGLTLLWWHAGRPKTFDTGPSVADTEIGRGAESLAAEHGPAALTTLAMQSYLVYHETNEPVMRTKRRAIDVAFALVTLETVCLALAGFLALSA